MQQQVAPKPRLKAAADCKPGSTVDFDDDILETAIRRQLRKPSGDISKTELAKVKTLDISQAAHNDQLDPCIFPHLTGLTGLYLAPGTLDDIGVLSKLTQLESIRLAATRVKDLTPLANLKKLDRLDIGRTPVTDISVLSGLPQLTNLMLDETEITDVTPLSQLRKLKILNIKRTRVSDVSPLKGLPRTTNRLKAAATRDFPRSSRRTPSGFLNVASYACVTLQSVHHESHKTRVFRDAFNLFVVLA